MMSPGDSGRLEGKVPVEKLDDVRLARIEKSILGALEGGGAAQVPPRKQREWFWPGMTAVCAAAALVFFFVPSAPAPGSELSQFTIVTGDAPSKVRIARAVVEVREDSVVDVERRGTESVTLRLADGRVDCDVEKIPNRPAFIVLAADVEVKVVGTAFTVERHGEQVSVRVERGIVAVTQAGDTVKLEAGQDWASAEWLAAAEAGAGLAAVEEAAVASAETKADGAGSSKEPAIASSAVRTSRTKAARPVAKNKARSPKANTSSSPASFSPYRRPGGLDAIMPSPRGTKEEVERHYRTLSLQRGDSARASLTLYSLAYWQLYRMRNPRSALQSADLYERRFRAGANAESVLWIRMAALCATHQDSKCRAAAHSYKRRYPGGKFARHAKSVIDRQEE